VTAANNSNDSVRPPPEDMQTSEIRYRRLFETARDGILILDAVTRKITDVNPYMMELLDFTRGEFLNKELWEIGVYHNKDESIAAFKDLQKNGYIRYDDLPLKSKSGKSLDVEFVSNVYTEGENQVIQCNIRDITERKHAQDERAFAQRQLQELNQTLEELIRERTAKLETANKELEAFSYSVSHDLRAPLRAIEGFSCALLEDYSGKIDDVGQNYLERVCDASRHMAQLIDDLLNFSRVTRSEIYLDNVNLSELVKSIADKLHERDPKRKVKFNIEENLIVNGDERLLRVAVQNLLENSWKFTSKKPAAKITFGRILSGEKPEYFVRDDGAGFDMAYADKLFGVFQRLHTIQEFDGTGIGLVTVQRIIQRHGGSIRAEGTVDKGAAFYFTL
jgi:PAS domain S-box-containing protein